ncbi:hypothetical protein GIB67_018234 [Kingdonia uniflora]|uniref:RNase H type-1 domain-containing protein n=1 Tax=Kingdonia uniflora TaxID=39325 RepID=A0A7J7NN43_9MAGN|nr:hypothetical protein GIB67_018234 [Kingdonia uniflora]
MQDSPAPNIVKIDTDGSCTEGCGGIGAVAKIEDGTVIEVAAGKTKAMSVFIHEIQAVEMVLKMAKEHGWKNCLVVFFSFARFVCSCINQEEFPMASGWVRLTCGMRAEYGDVTDVYNCDTFNENSPPTNDPAYISLLGAAVYKGMSKADKDAVWLMQVTARKFRSVMNYLLNGVWILDYLYRYFKQKPTVFMDMQGWLFSSASSFWKPPQMKALLHSVPFGKLIVLDLFADVKPIWETSSQFYGTPYVWCLLHNFGGNTEMYGILDAISLGPIDARFSKNSTLLKISAGYLFTNNAHLIWELLRKVYSQRGNNARIFQLSNEIGNFKQGTETLGMYYARLRSSWEELSHYDSFIEWPASAPSKKVPPPPTAAQIYVKIVEKT